VRSESRCALRLRYVDLLSVSRLPLKCAVVSLYSIVKQRLKCNTSKVCNCLIQFLLTMVLSIEERVFISAQRLSECSVFIFTYITLRRVTFQKTEDLIHTAAEACNHPTFLESSATRFSMTDRSSYGIPFTGALFKLPVIHLHDLLLLCLCIFTKAVPKNILYSSHVNLRAATARSTLLPQQRSVIRPHQVLTNKQPLAVEIT
jgi:hypothetical protein